MPIRLTPWLVIPVVAAAAAGGYLVADRTPSAAATPPADTVVVATAGPLAPGAATGALPPNHPPIGDMAGHAGGQGSAMGASDSQPSSIVWTAPSTWQVLPNPSPMRLATYKVSDGAELTVARAGGSVDANVQRWVAQFDGSPKADRAERQVSGMKVTVVRIAGSFLGGGMGGAAPEKKDGWAMLAAVVESTGSPYFFKLVGPADQVDHARAAFDALLASAKPNAAP